MIILLMGVSGSGKTTIGHSLAKSLHWEFQDADNFHSKENIDKMRYNLPLNDNDRMPWLQALEEAIKQWLQEDKNVVLACSALKASYRQFLMLDEELIKLVYLKGSFEEIKKRLQQRQNHYMSEKLLKSQFDDFEEPEKAISVDICQPPDIIVKKILEQLMS
jgi:gluconokinase